MAGNLNQSPELINSENASQRSLPLGNLLLGLDPLRGLFAPFSNNGLTSSEIRRSKDGFELEVAVPGFHQAQIDVTMRGATLSISGTAEKRNFARSLVLPEEIDTDKIAATVENGLLTVSLHRKITTEPRRIEIRSSAPVSNTGLVHDEQLNIHAAYPRSDTPRGARFRSAPETLHRKTEADAILESNV